MNFSQAMEVSKSIDEMAVSLRDKLCADIAELPFKGTYINDGKDGGAVIAVVKSSSIVGGSWDPHYHIPAAQSRAVLKWLNGRNSAASIVAAVRGMIANGYIGTNRDDRVYLNERTYQTVIESDIGQYIIKELADTPLTQ